MTLLAAMLMVGFSSVASSANPPLAPALYANGPASPLFAVTDLSAAERAAYTLYEAVLQLAQAKIHATSCGSTVGVYPIDIFTNGLVFSDPGRYNSVTVVSMNGEFTLEATLQNEVNFRGQFISIDQAGLGVLDGTDVYGFTGQAAFNEVNNMALQSGTAHVRGANGRFDSYQTRVIKDFYHGDGDEVYQVFAWGEQALSKLGYPAHKYWDRAKSRRSDGEIGRTVFVKDRLVGPTSCRIMIDTEGYNTEDFFWQDGYLTISTADPGEPAAEFSEF